MDRHTVCNHGGRITNSWSCNGRPIQNWEKFSLVFKEGKICIMYTESIVSTLRLLVFNCLLNRVAFFTAEYNDIVEGINFYMYTFSKGLL